MLESLAQGVPQVAIPVTFDQPGGCRTGQKDRVTPDKPLTISSLLNEVPPRVSENARKIQQAIAEPTDFRRRRFRKNPGADT